MATDRTTELSPFLSNLAIIFADENKSFNIETIRMGDKMANDRAREYSPLARTCHNSIDNIENRSFKYR
jgi:hypothetical protein